MHGGEASILQEGSRLGRRERGVLLAAISAMAFGLMPIFALHAYAAGVTVPTLLLLRFALAAMGFWLALLARRRPARVPGPALFQLALLGAVGYAGQSASYFTAIRYAPSSVVALVLYVYPVLVTLGEAALTRSPVTARTWAALSLGLGGSALVLWQPVGPVRPLGLGLALLAALVYTGYILLARRVTERVPPLTATAYVASFAAGTYVILGTAGGGLRFDFTPAGWAGVLAIALVSTVLAMWAFFRSIELVGATTASIVSTLEPLTTVVAAGLWLGEVLRPAQWAGGALILTAAVLIATAPVAVPRRGRQPAGRGTATASAAPTPPARH